MIQRIQTIWLFLAAAAAALTFRLPFYSGNRATTDPFGKVMELTASSNMILLFLTAVLVAGCIILIFFYKDRKTQLRLTIVAIVLSIINLVLYFSETKKFVSGNFALTAALSFLIPLFLLFAARGIWKDEKLVKSLDRLR